VLLETIETLQAGGASEQAQQVVALTAQLASAQAQGGAQKARLRELMVSWCKLAQPKVFLISGARCRDALKAWCTHFKLHTQVIEAAFKAACCA
jgi:hypothetical protein